jgi:hypothetical protein
MGRNRQVNQRKKNAAPVDAFTTRDWEAGTASEAGAWVSFWCWYLPSEEIQVGSRLRAVLRIARRSRALMRYPLYTAPVRGAVAKVPVRR